MLARLRRNTQDDVLDGGLGDDSLAGGAGSDRYVITWGMGHDTAIDADGGLLTLGPALSTSNLYGEIRGADFFLGIRHTDTGLLIKDYQASSWQVELSDTQVVDVASFALPARPETREALLQEALAETRADFYTSLTLEGYIPLADGTLQWRDGQSYATFSQLERSLNDAEITRETWTWPQEEYIDGRYETRYIVETISAGDGANDIWSNENSAVLTVVSAGGGDDVVTAYNYPGYSQRLADHRNAGVFIDGGAGDDLIDASAAGDKLFGGHGNDLLQGNGGGDTYFVFPDELGFDTIVDDGAAPAFYGGRFDELGQGYGDSFYLDAYYRSIGIEDWRAIPVESRPVVPATHDFAAWQSFYGQPIPDDSRERLIIDPDVVEFLPGVSVADLDISWGRVNLDSTYVTLDLNWATNAGIRVVIPHSTDSVGAGVEYFKFSDGNTLTMAQLIALAPPPPGFDPQHQPGTAVDDIVEGTVADDVVSAGAGNDYVQGLGGHDLIQGSSGNDQIRGGGASFANDKYWHPLEPRDFERDTYNSGNDALFGGDGNDELYGDDGSNLLVGDAGADVLRTRGSTLFIGATGADIIESWGDSIVAMNRGDGGDMFLVGGSPVVLSIGGGITLSDITLSRSGDDLRVGLGMSDSVLFQEWYLGTRSVTLQVIEGSVATYDFNAAVSHFDSLRSQNPSLTNWQAQGVLQSHALQSLSSSAYGGELAYQYAMTGNLNSLTANEVLDVLGHEDFVVAPQSVDPLVGGGGLTLRGGPGNDNLTGGEGNDSPSAKDGDDLLDGVRAAICLTAVWATTSTSSAMRSIRSSTGRDRYGA